MDRPVLKALDIFVYLRQVKTKLSLQKAALSVHEEREHELISSPAPSTMTAITTWKESSSEESTGKLGLKGDE